MKTPFLMVCALIGCAAGDTPNSDLPRSGHCRPDESTAMCYVRLSSQFRKESIDRKKTPPEVIEEQKRFIRRLQMEDEKRVCLPPSQPDEPAVSSSDELEEPAPLNEEGEE